MIRSVSLHEWTTVNELVATAAYQPVSEYVDMEEGVDVTFLSEVSDCVGTALSVSSQTAPIQDDRLFRTTDNVVISTAAIPNPS